MLFCSSCSYLTEHIKVNIITRKISHKSRPAKKARSSIFCGIVYKLPPIHLDIKCLRSVFHFFGAFLVPRFMRFSFFFLFVFFLALSSGDARGALWYPKCSPVRGCLFLRTKGCSVIHRSLVSMLFCWVALRGRTFSFHSSSVGYQTMYIYRMGEHPSKHIQCFSEVRIKSCP